MTKREILAEIKRTAEANGGIPLGRARFYQETGLKESNWYGRYWATWGDALREAGFSPNPLNPAFTEDHLISRYAQLVRELGKLPRHADLRLKRRTDPSFPSHNTYARFGSKTQLVARVREYCRTLPELGDVLAIIDRNAPRLEPAPEEHSAPPEPLEPPLGFVYLIKSGRHYKIGKTNAVGRRERELAIQLPEKARTVHVIRTDDPSGIEAYWHQRFAPKRGNGEWFMLDARDIAAFRRRKFM